MINIFISANGSITHEQKTRLCSLTSKKDSIIFCAGHTNHDFQKLWAGINATKLRLNRTILFFDEESMHPSQIYQCLKVLCRLNTGNQKAMTEIKAMITDAMYKIGTQGNISILEFDLINSELFPKYFVRPVGMLCESLI